MTVGHTYEGTTSATMTTIAGTSSQSYDALVVQLTRLDLNKFILHFIL
jgi:hypothetical protein